MGKSIRLVVTFFLLVVVSVLLMLSIDNGITDFSANHLPSICDRFSNSEVCSTVGGMCRKLVSISGGLLIVWPLRKKFIEELSGDEEAMS